jgi:hypothetical protein
MTVFFIKDWGQKLSLVHRERKKLSKWNVFLIQHNIEVGAKGTSATGFKEASVSFPHHGARVRNDPSLGHKHFRLSHKNRIKQRFTPRCDQKLATNENHSHIQYHVCHQQPSTSSSYEQQYKELHSSVHW